MRFGWLVLLCYLGALTHPLLDVLTTYSVQLLSPFSNLWFHADGLFIIDFWVWLALALGIGISKRRERKGRPWHRPAQIAVVAVLAYIGANLIITQRAEAAVRAVAPEAEALFASPPPVLFWQRDMVWREGDCYRRSEFVPFGSGLGPVSECQPNNMSLPVAREAILRDPRLRKFLKWSILPQAEVVEGRCSAKVFIGDARYGEGRRSKLARETIVPTHAPGC